MYKLDLSKKLEMLCPLMLIISISRYRMTGHTLEAFYVHSSTSYDKRTLLQTSSGNAVLHTTSEIIT